MEKSTCVDPRSALGIVMGTTDGPVPILDASSVLHMAGSSGLSGDYQGAESISGVLSRMAELTDQTLRFDTREVLIADDETLVWRGRVEATRPVGHLDSEVVCILSLDGKRMREMWLFHVDHDPIDRFWMASSPGVGPGG